MSLSHNYSGFNNASKTILEALLYKFPDIKNIYNMLDIGTISSSEHPEINNIASNFTSPTILISIGILANCYIIQRQSKTKFHYIEISSEVTYNFSNKGKLIDDICNNINIKDFVPEPLSKKIVFITNYEDDIQGIIYTKIKKGFILGNDNLNIRNKRVLKKNAWQLTKEILNKLDIAKE